MRKIYEILFFMGIAAMAQAQMAALEPTEPAASRDPVRFTHIPILLLRINPTTLFGYNNTLQYGVEIAPPVGKFSFSFDYGKGKGSNNFNKYVKKNQAENLNKEFRGEIKMYFSDWFPFFAFDKKPFGRYYSFEYVQGQYDRSVDMAIGIGGATLPSFAKFKNVAYTEKTQVMHLKFGKHIHLNKHLFLDTYAGLGLGKYTSIDTISSVDDLETIPLHFGFLSNKKLRKPGTKGLYFSKTAGIRIAIPL
jgi:hypothetical protein